MIGRLVLLAIVLAVVAYAWPRVLPWLGGALAAVAGLLGLLLWLAQPSGRPTGCERLRDLWRPHVARPQAPPPACDAAGRELRPAPALRLVPVGPDRVQIVDDAHPYRDRVTDTWQPAPLFEGTAAAAAGAYRRLTREQTYAR